MRLTDIEIQSIKRAVSSFDQKAKILLFGSRTDDAKRGGDIDLLILSQTITDKNVRKIRRDICDDIGEQKIDIIVAKDMSKPFVRIAYSDGIEL